ncbi:MAG: 23S rRNA (adenine(2503)-C(2))-methyltransferase RlmN [Prevotellaceae bacterium]|jgi:23S rRNA (adenine2503-C2)-methyltransferase|nr:23S rRNA (adenine(2503)-C(2))-methyltransferase RlmN [Prevotellaceae bacterium]
MKNFLFGKTLNELDEVVSQLSLPRFTAKQIADWLYKKRVTTIDEMTNISLENRQKLAKTFSIGISLPTKNQISADGTKKYIFESRNRQKVFIESVYIPESDRATLCVSSQAGCKMACKFCMTGRQSFQLNLSSGEILNQICSIPDFDSLTNIVYMGMGEPFDNIENVLKSLEIITSDYGFAWSPKRITVSTIGIIPAMMEFINKSKCHLAVSLHNPFDYERLQLMPIQKKYPVKEIIQTLNNYDFSHQRRLSFEYIMFDEINDTPRHSKGLADLLRGLDCRINLIRFHEIPDCNLRPSKDEAIDKFQKYLNGKNILTTLRTSRGTDILAACGMLSTKEMNKNIITE